MSGVFLMRMRVYLALRIVCVLSMSRARHFSSVVLYRGFPPWVKRPSYSMAILCSWFTISIWTLGDLKSFLGLVAFTWCSPIGVCYLLGDEEVDAVWAWGRGATHGVE